MTNEQIARLLIETFDCGGYSEAERQIVRLAAQRLDALTAAAAQADALIQRWRETGNPPSMTEWMALQDECRRAAGIM